VQEATREGAPATPAAQPAPKITLEGTDSPSYARAFGDRIIPAAPNAVFHNRPPEYPEEAALNGEHGTVVVLVHISPAGTAAGVDLVRSSGYELLDRAARQAVLRWRFLPAVKDGQPVASDMTMGFDFEND
jgi:protein TonB